ncbi:hypothetical protein [Lysobacter firmicutimachus]|uniref:Secreted protein n=1 Tax=Lysobacter firmicutimachus TaxID=1792846 RepID=A0ABU8D4R1_9GAMM
MRTLAESVHRHVLARFMLTVAAAMASAVASPAPAWSCKQRLLQDLGWRFEPDATAPTDVQAGRPCDRADLQDAKAHGDLTVRWPPELSVAERERRLDQLLRHPATVCAYGYALGAATRRAVDRLSANGGFGFTGVQLGWIGFGPTGARHDGWRATAWFGRGYRPAGANSRAIEAFYRGRMRGECGLGRQIAQYAAQLELYGPAGFDREFAADEIAIGTFNRIRRSRSILLGSSAGEFSRDGIAVQASRSGRQAFMGLPGFIYHVFDRSALDDINNQAENFVVYDVSAAAADALRRHRGFEHYNRRNREIWTLARGLRPRPLRRYYERLLYELDPALRAELSADARAALARIDTELSDPFYRGFEVYVHKQGVKPVGYHIARLLDRNPRTPFRIELGLHNLHTTLYRRYIAHRLAQCGARTETPASDPAAGATAAVSGRSGSPVR